MCTALLFCTSYLLFCISTEHHLLYLGPEQAKEAGRDCIIHVSLTLPEKKYFQLKELLLLVVAVMHWSLNLTLLGFRSLLGFSEQEQDRVAGPHCSLHVFSTFRRVYVLYYYF